MEKEDYFKWFLKKDITIDEASYLWFGVNPYNPEGLTPNLITKISIIKKRLTKAYELGKIGLLNLHQLINSKSNIGVQSTQIEIADSALIH